MTKLLTANFKYPLGNILRRNFKLSSVDTHQKYRIALVHPESYETALAFMKNHFSDDPLSEAMGASKTKDFANLVEYMWFEDLRKGLSLQALSTETNKMVGLAINAVSNETENLKRFREFSEVSNSQPTKNLIKAWEELIHLSVLMPSIQRPETVFELSGVAVSNDHRGMGIAKKLLLQSLFMAKCHGFKIAKIDCTNEFSALAAKSIGFQCIYEKPFELFKGVKKVKEPHTHVRVLVKPLDGFLF